MSLDLGMDDDELTIGLEDIKPSVVNRLLRNMVTRAARRKKMAGKRDSGDTDTEEPDEALEEMQKNSSLHSEKKGSAAPLQASEADFAKGDLRRALKSMPKGTLKKRK